MIRILLITAGIGLACLLAGLAFPSVMGIIGIYGSYVFAISLAAIGIILRLRFWFMSAEDKQTLQASKTGKWIRSRYGLFVIPGALALFVALVGQLLGGLNMTGQFGIIIAEITKISWDAVIIWVMIYFWFIYPKTGSQVYGDMLLKIFPPDKKK